MTSRQKKLRFLLVGIANTTIDFGLLFIITSLHVLPLVPANMIATGAALAFSFIANRSFTFNAAQSNRTIQTMLKFFSVTLIGLWVLQPVVLVFTEPLLGTVLKPHLGLFAAKVAATVVSMIWNYLLYDRFVFKNKGAE